MTTRLPVGRGCPTPAGSTSSPWPGAQADNHGVSPRAASEAPGSAVSPKQVQPFPPASAASACAANAGGTRNKMAWCTSTLFGKNWLETMKEFVVTFGLTSVQW